MAYEDLRAFLTVLKRAGELQPIAEEVDWNLEAGAIIRRCNELGGPAILFQRIRGYPRGYRILGGPLATFKRLALALSLPPETSYHELVDAYLERQQRLLPPILAASGPCKEVVMVGKEVNLWKFPVPLIHQGDGGRYIGTWHLLATRDPDTQWINWGIYRLMVHDERSLGVLIGPTQHGGMILRTYEERNLPMQVAIAIGTEPICPLVAASPVPAGVSEADVAGGLRGKPLQMVNCETVDLMVPATAEIVIEGEILPGKRREEGPFGEYTGYQSGGRASQPVIDVKAITHRRNPILTVSCLGTPIDECDIAMNIVFTANMKADLLRAGFPITAVAIPVESSGTLCVVATKTPYRHISKRIAACLWANKSGVHIPRVMVVNEDVDPADLSQVLFAFATKCHPLRGTTVLEGMPTSRLLPFLDEEERRWNNGSTVVYDCTWPVDWPPEQIPRLASFAAIYPQEIRQKVLQKWRRYGFKGDGGRHGL